MGTLRVRNKEGDEWEVDSNRLPEAEKDGYLPVVSDGLKDYRVESINLDQAKQDGFTVGKYYDRFWFGKATEKADEGGFQSGLPEIDPIESFAMGAGDIATYGNLDEIGGKLKSLFGDGSSEQNRDSIRKRLKTSADENWKSHLAGQVAAGVAMSAIPGFAPAKGADALRKGLNLFGHSAGYGVGDSEESIENPLGLAGDALESGAKGVMGGVAGAAAGKALKGVGKLSKKGYGYLVDLPEEVIEGILEDPKAFRGAKNLEGMTDQLIDNLKALKTKVLRLDDHANKFLTNKPVDTDSIMRKFWPVLIRNDLMIRDRGGRLIPSKVNNAAYQEISKYIKELKTRDPSEKNIKKLIRTMQDSVNWDDASRKKLNETLISLERLTNEALKNQNPEYRQAMLPLAKSTSLLSRAQKQFKVNKFLEPTDKTSGKLKNLRMDVVKPEPLRPQSQKIIEDLDPYMLKDLEYSRLRDLGRQQSTQGSRKTLLGLSIGNYFGGNPGMVAGALGGYVMDKAGRKVGSEALLRLAESKQTFNKFLKQGLGINASDSAKEYLRNALIKGGAASFQTKIDILTKMNIITLDE